MVAQYWSVEPAIELLLGIFVTSVSPAAGGGAGAPVNTKQKHIFNKVAN